MLVTGALMFVGALISLYLSVDFLRPVPRSSPF